MSKPSDSARNRAADVGADGKTVFTRVQAARFLGVKVGTVKAAERRGALQAMVVHGVHLFARLELERYRAGRHRGQLAAQCFKLLRDGCSVGDVVIELEIDPELAQEWARQYAQLEGYVLAAAPPRSRKAWEAAFGVRLTPQLVLRAVELAARTPQLRERLLSTPSD